MSIDDFDIPPATDSSDYPWPDGTYHVTLRSLTKESENPFGDEPRIRFEFRVNRVLSSTDRKLARQMMGDGELMRATKNLKMSKTAKFRQWCEALLGRPIDDKEKIRPSMVLSRDALATVGEYSRPDGKGTSRGIANLAAFDEEEDDDPPFATSAAASGGGKPERPGGFDRPALAGNTANPHQGVGDPATERQIKAIYAIGRAGHLSDADIAQRSQRRFGYPPEQLQRHDASGLIDLLKDEIASAQLDKPALAGNKAESAVEDIPFPEEKDEPADF